MCSRRDIKKGRCLPIAGHNEIHVLLKLKTITDEEAKQT